MLLSGPYASRIPQRSFRGVASRTTCSFAPLRGRVIAWHRLCSPTASNGGLHKIELETVSNDKRPLAPTQSPHLHHLLLECNPDLIFTARDVYVPNKTFTPFHKSTPCYCNNRAAHTQVAVCSETGTMTLLSSEIFGTGISSDVEINCGRMCVGAPCPDPRLEHNS